MQLVVKPLQLQTLMGVGRRTKVDPGQGVTEERFFEMLRSSINTAGIRLDDFENIFSMLDIDGNERLGAEELETALTAMNERVPEQVLSSLLLVRPSPAFVRAHIHSLL
jgi:Ca2+-binding EF-hand superfamily protein